MMAKQRHGQDSRESCSPQNDGRSPRCSPAAPASQHHRTHREAFGNFVQEDGEKDEPAQRIRNQEARRDCDAVKKCVNNQSQKNRISLVRVDEFIVVRLFAKMKMGSYRVLEEMNDQITEQN